MEKWKDEFCDVVISVLGQPKEVMQQGLFCCVFIDRGARRFSIEGKVRVNSQTFVHELGECHVREFNGTRLDVHRIIDIPKGGMVPKQLRRELAIEILKLDAE